MKSSALDFITIDFETANYARHSACSVGLIRFINGREEDSLSSLIRPPDMFFLPEWTEEIHHIGAKDVEDKPLFPDVWENLMLPFIKESPRLPLAAHNASFDMGVIYGCCNYFGIRPPAIPYIDSLRIAERTWPKLESHRLTALAEHFNINYTAHDALEDARTCGKIITLAAGAKGVYTVQDLLHKTGLQEKTL